MIRIKILRPSLKVSFEGVTVTHHSEDPYEGSYEVTPSRETQILNTKDKRMLENVKINPIPSNYGLITYNGFELTVS